MHVDDSANTFTNWYILTDTMNNNSHYKIFFHEIFRYHAKMCTYQSTKCFKISRNEFMG